MLTEDQLAELRTKHGRIAHIVGEDAMWEVVLKPPSRQQYIGFKAAQQDDAQKPKATEMLFRSMLIFPAATEIDALLEQFPAIPEACSEDILSLMGAKVQKRSK